ncbi:MAG: helix-turn-helix transcriptional regulator [Alphaproteobacteria bacterium]|nr:helix-turn-helix transcriptional regulator [Alphaproteobacteria bacterium]MCB9694433.1 helix-turn-helix transcriptional regulator [Alphaproteobacteria bacterium]
MEAQSAALGARIRALRTAREWSQETLAEKAEMHPQTLSRIERGTHLPSLTHARALACALEVDANGLFGDTFPESVVGPGLAALLERLRVLPDRHQTNALRLVEIYLSAVERE